jgi:hypothetical protein
MSWPYIPDDPTINTYGQDGGYCEVCDEHIDSGRCPGHCENETCGHESHCDACERGFDFELPDGVCIDCEIRWLASHQIGYVAA